MRKFGKIHQQHDCAPSIALEEYFETGPEFERPIFETVLAHLRSLDPDIYFEPLPVGIFFKRRTTFVQLRTMSKWVALCFNLDRKLDTQRISRKVIEHGGRFYHVENVVNGAAIDEEVQSWLTEAWHSDAPSGHRP